MLCGCLRRETTNSEAISLASLVSYLCFPAEKLCRMLRQGDKTGAATVLGPRRAAVTNEPQVLLFKGWKSWADRDVWLKGDWAGRHAVQCMWQDAKPQCGCLPCCGFWAS